ncbi:integrase domain-containing protein SAM domain-containing protein [Halovivax asiaticus JCM 14624]|uniref:Integrase domain-containing protein SAM domain-containing protein n=1 Tax=Halovivax asiaticus JCM 14624 TaxID=1227490 RepID=M0BQC7_9EURY|nr:site-specific integrase [Halovivax asiaticus]ELZ12533.1 integrase domain-containing protein SAM domain-containing protein [Halovivax asiaticus JCM 14624]
MTLEPIDPETALELYLDQKETEVSVATLRSHRSRLGHFVRWCDDRELTNLNELTGRKIHEYRLWRRNEGELSKVSLKTQMDTLRVFVRWLGTIDAVDPDLHVKVQSPNLRPGDNVREVMLDSEDAEAALDYLERYEYASLPHVTMALLWHTMMRMGAAHALDIGDYSPEDQCVSVVHRPDEGTPIKNGTRGERLVGLSGELCLLLDDWLRDRRPDVTDDYGREPLLATSQGRASKSAIRTYSYRYTQPCAYGDECPHGREPDDCEATRSDHVSKCPSSISPHAIRRGSITHHLTSDVPETAVSDRANVSTKVIEKHYDQRTKKEKMEQRRQYLKNI